MIATLAPFTTATAFGLIGWGIYYAFGHLCAALKLTERDADPFGCTLHSQDKSL